MLIIGDIYSYCILDLRSHSYPKNKIGYIRRVVMGRNPDLARVERVLSNRYSKIILHVSIDSKELKKTVIRRVNFYIKNKYRVSI